MIKFFTIITLLFALQSCLFTKKIAIKTTNNIKLIEKDFLSINGWQEDDHRLALQAFLQSCRKFATLPQNTSLNKELLEITPSDFRDVCDIGEVVKNMSPKQTKNFFENWFKIFLVENNNGKSEGLFTGYYEATLKGSFVKTDKYKFPIYAKPNDFNINSKLTRLDIENGALDSQKIQLLYVDDKIDLFFMHIQGSGQVILPNGGIVKLSYAGKNIHPFVAISNEMFNRGYISKDEYNSKGVRNWLKNNPDKADEIMNLNQSYTFFKINDSEYVIGGQGVPLTNERSLAVDNEIIPYGSLLWLESYTKKDDEKQPFNHLMVAQDTGSAIKGPVRGDVFFGAGNDAEEMAFTMASKGKYYMLLPINFVDKILGR